MADKEVPLLVREEPVVIDRRLLSINTYDFAAEAYVPVSLEEHRKRSEWVKQRLLLCAGLLPGVKLPEAEPVNFSPGKSYHGVVIKEVAINSLPGLKLTGSLFLPEKFEGRLPGLLCPHGHWPTGRIHHAKDGGVVMRCFELAKLGFAVFAYDMIGYNDCNDFPHYWDNELKKRGNLAGITPFGLQTVNSMRAVDFITSLPEVDPERIGCTGASGGGSQTWFISALDDRIKVLAPVCMLSSHFQGGCACEEGPALRVNGLTSFDIVAACAPRPVMLPSVTGDWTNFNPWYEIPQLKKVYALFGAADQVHNFHYEDCHNYNRRTREHIYAFLVRELQGIDRGEKIPESDDAPPPPELIWHGGVKPAEATAETIETAFAALKKFYVPESLDSGSDPEARKSALLAALRELLATENDFSKGVVERLSSSWEIPGGMAKGRIISNRGVGDRVISVDVVPDEIKSDEVMIIAASGSCKEWFFEGGKAGIIAGLVEKGVRCRLVELTGSGTSAWQLEHAIRNPENYTYAFDESFFSMRVRDVISAVELLRTLGEKKLRIFAAGAAVAPALAAAALTGVPVTADLAGVDDSTWDDPLNYQVLIKCFGGIGGLMKLNSGKDNSFINIPE